jgi:hypothetical protein
VRSEFYLDLLIKVIFFGSVDCVKNMLDCHKVDFETTKLGCSGGAMFLALFEWREETRPAIVELLLEYGVDPSNFYIKRSKRVLDLETKDEVASL